MRLLITGGNGATAWYLKKHIEEHHPEHEMYEITKPTCDLNDLGAVIRVMQVVKPHRIYHLAAMPHVHESFALAHQTLSNNILGTMNLFEAIDITKTFCRVLVTSSCEVYGIPQYSPVDEKHPFNPVSPYAVSKCSVDYLSQMYAKRGLHIVISRMFNHINPRAERLFSTSFAKQVAAIERGEKEYLVHGNLESGRTLLDVRDVVRGYYMLLEDGVSGEAYNIGASEETTLNDFIHMLRGAASCPIKLKPDPKLIRPIDITKQVADSSKFIGATGWKPEFTLHDSVKMLLDYWRTK